MSLALQGGNNQFRDFCKNPRAAAEALWQANKFKMLILPYESQIFPESWMNLKREVCIRKINSCLIAPLCHEINTGHNGGHFKFVINHEILNLLEINDKLERFAIFLWSQENS